MLATETPQHSVNRALPRPADGEIVIVGSGRETPRKKEGRKQNGEPYIPGREGEYEDARHSPHQPSVLVYRRMEDPKVNLRDPQRKEKEEQFERVERFFDQFRNPDGSLAGGVNTYESPSAFKNLLRQHLEQLVWDRLNSCSGADDHHR